MTPTNLYHNLRRLSAAILLTLVVVAFSSCSEKQAKLIPADCSAVIKIDVASIYDKSGAADNEDVKDICDKLLDLAKEKEDMSRSTLDEVRKYVEDPTELGIDFSSPIYCFGPSESFNYVGFVAKVSKESRVEDALEVFRKASDGDFKLREYDACKILTDSREGGAFAYNDDVFMFAVPVRGRDADLLRDVRKRFELEDEKDCFTETEAFKVLSKTEGDVTFAASCDGIFKLMDKSDREYYKLDDKTLEQYRAMGYAGSLSFEDESINFYYEVFGLNDKLKADFEKAYNNFNNVQGKWLANMPASTFIYCALNVDGAKLWKLISEQPAMQTYLNDKYFNEYMSNFRDALTSLNGEMALGLAIPQDDHAPVPDMALLAEVASKEKADNFVSTMVEKYYGNYLAEPIAASGEEADTTVAPTPAYDDYSYNYGSYGSYCTPTPTRVMTKEGSVYTFGYDSSAPYYYTKTPPVIFGTEGKAFFMTNTQSITPSSHPSASAAKSAWAENSKGHKFYVAFDFNPFLKNETFRGQLREARMLDAAEKCDYIECYDEGLFKVVAKFHFKNLGKNETPAKLICDCIVSALSRELRRA